MNIADAQSAYNRAREAYLLAAEDLGAALGQDVAALTKSVNPRIEAIREAVMAEFGISIECLLGRSRRREHVEPRMAFYGLIVEVTGLSVSTLGRFLNRHPGSISWAVTRCANLCATDKKFAAAVTRARLRLK
jgi:chromosomal replication initiation ATPase DnaA